MSIRIELAQAAREINLEFHKLDEQGKEKVEPMLEALGTLPDEVSALPIGEARALISEWRDSNISRIRLAACPRPYPRTQIH